MVVADADAGDDVVDAVVDENADVVMVAVVVDDVVGAEAAVVAVSVDVVVVPALVLVTELALVLVIFLSLLLVTFLPLVAPSPPLLPAVALSVASQCWPTWRG